WTVDAALVALSALARDEEDIAAEITSLFQNLSEGSEHFSFYPALLWCSLRLPNLTEDERTALRQRLRHWQDDRAAQHHFRQAMAHADKGEVDKAIEELTQTVRLDPKKADAFQERALLSVRKGKAQDAVADFTQALQLQPESAAGYMG